MNILVCGGAGYIGSNMVALLHAEGHRPIVYDNLSRGHASALRGQPLVKGDLADKDLLVKTMQQERIDAVMHFAAFIEVGESVAQPLAYYHNNVCNTHTVLSAMEQAGVERFVFSSTAATYGMPEIVPIDEQQPKQPINPYGETKLAAEQMCHWQAETGRLRYAALRYFNACGAGRGATLGEDHDPETHLIPLIIQAAMGQREQALAGLRKLEAVRRQQYFCSCEIAMLHLMLQQPQQALEFLEQAFQERSAKLMFLNVNPVFDPLRADPRFETLLRRMNLGD